MLWKNLKIDCEHCGRGIECRPVVAQVELSGFEPMEYRHIHDKKSECVVVSHDVAKPYTGCGIRAAYNNN